MQVVPVGVQPEDKSLIIMWADHKGAAQNEERPQPVMERPGSALIAGQA